MVQIVSMTVHFQEIYLYKIQVFSGGPCAGKFCLFVLLSSTLFLITIVFFSYSDWLFIRLRKWFLILVSIACYIPNNCNLWRVTWLHFCRALLSRKNNLTAHYRNHLKDLSILPWKISTVHVWRFSESFISTLCLALSTNPKLLYCGSYSVLVKFLHWKVCHKPNFHFSINSYLNFFSC